MFVTDGIGQEAPWEEIRDQVLRRSERFVEQPALGLRDKRLLKEIPRRQCFATQLTLSQLFGAKTRTDRVRRNNAIRSAHCDYGYSVSEIDDAVSLRDATISRIANPQNAD